MRNRWQIVAFVAEIVLLGVFAMDLGERWSQDALPGIRVLAIVAAALFAGAMYIHWETARVRVPATHAAAALGLIGGALAVSSVFTHGLDVVFRSLLLASIGLSAMVLSYVLGQLSLFAQEDSP